MNEYPDIDKFDFCVGIFLGCLSIGGLMLFHYTLMHVFPSVSNIANWVISSVLAIGEIVAGYIGYTKG